MVLLPLPQQVERTVSTADWSDGEPFYGIVWVAIVKTG
jgi:hypothetical protein